MLAGLNTPPRISSKRAEASVDTVLHKLLIVVRSDMPAGDQIAQAVHAAIEHTRRNCGLAKSGSITPETVVALGIDSATSLSDLLARADCTGAPFTPFFEPDMGGALTAAAIGPGREAERVCRGLPLALAPIDNGCRADSNTAVAGSIPAGATRFRPRS